MPELHFETGEKVLSTLRNNAGKRPGQKKVPEDKLWSVYKNYRLKALIACFVGYSGYYIVRYNYTLSTPYLQSDIGLSVTQVGLLSNILVITYGISKGGMGVLSDRFNPKYFLAIGLFFCSMLNIGLAFNSALIALAVLVALNGVFQGMGSPPCYVTIAQWFPRLQRGRAGAVWNVSQNFGGGVVAPIAAGGIFVLGTSGWQLAYYLVPAVVGLVIVAVILTVGKGSPVSEGLPNLDGIYKSEAATTSQLDTTEEPSAGLSSWQVLRRYVLSNKNAWYTSFVDVFVYVTRFGMISWMPLYLLHEKGYSEGRIGVVFVAFEWCAIPSTLIAGWLSDKLFKGRRMPLALIACILTGISMFGYWLGTSLVVLTISAGLIGCLLYVTQLMANVQCMEIVPSFAVGSVVGLRGFLGYIVGATLGTSLFGVLVDNFGWDAGIFLIFVSVIACGILCSLSQRELNKSVNMVDAKH